MGASFNLCDQPWIRVKYLDGNIKEIGLTQVFEDADKIKDIMPPMFRGDLMHIYVVSLIRLFTTIVMAAHYKKDTGYEAEDLDYVRRLKKKGIYSKYLKSYLKKYYDRFDLFSASHPFLQNKRLRPELEKELKGKESENYLSWNPFAPSCNNKVFGRNRCVDPTKETVLGQYQICPEELAYILLYFAQIGNYPASTASREGSFARNASIFMVVKGATLSDTILANIYPLSESSNPDKGCNTTDRPVWELDDLTDIGEFSMDEIPHNRLLCTFFPAISILSSLPDTSGYIYKMVRVNRKNEIDDYGVSPDFTKKVSDTLSYIDCSAFIIMGTNGVVYKPYNPENDSLTYLPVLAATDTEGVGQEYNCALLDTIEVGDAKKVYLYYRELDQYHVNILSCGFVDGINVDTWAIMKDDAAREAATEYRKVLSKLKKTTAESYRKLYTGTENVKGHTTLPCKIALSELSEWFEEDFFGEFTDSLIECKEKSSGYDIALKDAVNRLCDKSSDMFKGLSYSGRDAFNVEEAKKHQFINLKKIRESYNGTAE